MFASDGDSVYVADFAKTVLAMDKKDGGVRVISQMEAAPGYVIADPPWVAWLNVPYYTKTGAGGVLRRAMSGSILAPRALPGPVGLASDSGYLYWLELTTHEMMRLAKNDPGAMPESLGAFGPPKALPDPSDYSHGIVADGARVLAGVNDATDNDGSVTVVEFSACRAPVARYKEPAPMYGRIVADAKAVYWGSFGGNVRRMVT